MAKYKGLRGSMIVSYVIFVCLACAIRTAGAVDKPVEQISALVNGEKIFERDIQSTIDALLPREFYHGKISPEKRDEFRAKALNESINKVLYYQEAKRKGLNTDKKEIDNAMKKLRSRFRSEEEYKKALKAGGYTQESFERDIEVNLLVNKFIDQEILDKSKVNDEELKEFYEANKKDFLRPETLRVRHILIKIDPAATKEEREKAKRDAEDILARARSGEDFADLASRHSMDDWRVKGGDLGPVHRGRLDPTLEDSIFKLEIGQISDLILTIYGYHIVKLEEKVPPTQLTFDDIKFKLKKQMESRRKKELEEGILKRLKENAKIEIY